MPSPADVCNTALAMLGSSQRITDLTDRSKEAVLFSQIYDMTRDAALAATHWPFAKRVTPLALTATDPTDEWAYRYALPRDCVRARYILIPGMRPAMTPRSGKIPFEIGADADGDKPALFTDQADAQLVYTSNLPGPGTYPPTFAWAFARMLAAAAAMPITKDKDVTRLAEAAAFQWHQRAVALQFSEGQLDEPPESDYITSRR